ncbi:MAG: prolyl oligopeptidase family serine peptidase [Pseudomonadota bacterium]
MKLMTALLALGLASSTLADAPGMAELSVDAAHHEHALSGIVMYPTEVTSGLQSIGGNPVFKGVNVVPDADPLDGRYPLILLSHGMGGTVRSLAWLAQDLAARGAIVASVNHPNSTWGDFEIARATEHWTRAQDLRAVLDHMLAHEELAELIDTDRIMAAGFSYGGWTALSLAGVQGNLDGYKAHCAMFPTQSAHCSDMRDAGVELSQFSAELWNAPYADARVTHVAAIDPGLVWGIAEIDLQIPTENLRLISLGDGEDRLFATDFDASGFADRVPGAAITRIEPATHFSAMPRCTAIGADILADEGEDPVCTDPEGAVRAGIHQEILDVLAGDLGL